MCHPSELYTAAVPAKKDRERRVRARSECYDDKSTPLKRLFFLL